MAPVRILPFQQEGLKPALCPALWSVWDLGLSEQRTQPSGRYLYNPGPGKSNKKIQVAGTELGLNLLGAPFWLGCPTQRV